MSWRTVIGVGVLVVGLLFAFNFIPSAGSGLLIGFCCGSAAGPISDYEF
jgi:hypothetical protein